MEVIQERAFIAEKNPLNTPKIHNFATSGRSGLVFEGRSGIFAAFLFPFETL